VLFGPTLQRTTAVTESIYLLVKYYFVELHHLRVEWKVDNLNEPSKKTAIRMEFCLRGRLESTWSLREGEG
jgi:RimJ/RimL family protein N-acetyltransferase